VFHKKRENGKKSFIRERERDKQNERTVISAEEPFFEKLSLGTYAYPFEIIMDPCSIFTLFPTM
jgi:hypothetical protein